MPLVYNYNFVSNKSQRALFEELIHISLYLEEIMVHPAKFWFFVLENSQIFSLFTIPIRLNILV